jgi:3-phosphoshikimate 1-carboxyvinyltransferase
VPADISSAAFFIVLGVIMPNSLVTIEGVGLNPTRMGIVQVLRRMGADIKVKNQKLKVKNAEPIGDIIVATSQLKATVIKREEIPMLIDEIPILMVAASFARGRTVFQDAQELRVKETDRIVSMVKNLRAVGVRAEINKTAQGENVAVYGAGSVCAGRVESFGDHRTAMSMIVAGLCAQGKVQIDDISCLNKSFPDFLSVLKPLLAK